MNRATYRLIQRPRHNLIYQHRKVSFRPKRPLHVPLKERQIHRRIDETIENMDIQLSARIQCRRKTLYRTSSLSGACLRQPSEDVSLTTKLEQVVCVCMCVCVCVCVLSIQQHVLRFILSITQLTIQKRQERDARSSSSIEQEGKLKPLQYLQKALGPAMDISAERKLLRNRKCDLEGNE